MVSVQDRDNIMSQCLKGIHFVSFKFKCRLKLGLYHSTETFRALETLHN